MTPEVVVAVELHVLEQMHVHPCMSLFFKHASLPLSQVLSHQSLSVQAVLSGGGVCGGGVIWQRASAAWSGSTVQQVLQLSGHAAREGYVDPRVGA